MKTRNLKLAIFTLLFFELTSCTPIFTGLYGIKKVKTVDENMIVRYSKKYNIPIADSYEIDTTYFSFLFSLDTALYKEQIKNHYQPLQALYHDKSGQLQSFQVNCYAGGFPNLKWERNKIMTTFPPQIQAPLDSIVPLETHLKYLKPLSRTTKFQAHNYEHIVIVHWNRFMGRQSKRLIRIVQENCKLVKDKKVKIIYANTDNLFIERLENDSK
jgi:hypothetical protein